MQVVILHKEIAHKIAETVHCAKHRSPRAAGSRRRAAQIKRPMGLFIPQVIRPLIIEEGLGAVPVLLKGLLIGVIANLIHVEHFCVPLSFICLYYSTLLEVCQVLFLVSGDLFHQIPDDVILTICVVIVLSTINNAFFFEFIQNINQLETIDTQIHCDGTQAQTVGTFTQDFNNSFFHCCFLLCFCIFIIAHGD